jgi:cytosine/adenosine deaminase-related metal-dependent hydrolase
MDQVAEADALCSPKGWHERSVEQFQHMVRAGFAAGDYGTGALRELERRAREHAAAEEQQAQVIAAAKQERRIRVLAGLLVGLLIAIGLVLFIR